MSILIKLKTGWINSETHEFSIYGQFSLDIYKKYRSIIQEGKEEIIPNIRVLLSVIEYCIIDLNEVDDFKPITKFSSSGVFFYKDRDENHQKLLELVRKQGWKDVPEDITLHPIDIFLLRYINYSDDLHVIPRFIDGKWYATCDSEDIISLLILDLMEMCNCGYKFYFCKNCSNIHIQKGTNRKYCAKCSSEYKRIADSERKNSPRYIHKSTRDYMRNSGKFLSEEIAAFSEESDYYWDRLQGKKTSTSDAIKYTAEINTPEEYREWCKKKHAEFKVIAKARKN